MGHIPRFHCAHITEAQAGGLFLLESATANHARVLKLQAGDGFIAFNEGIGAWRAEISTINKKFTQAKLLEQIAETEPLPNVELCFAPIKPDRLRVLVEKCAEIGIASLRPIITEWTVAVYHQEKLQAWLGQAIEQSGRIRMPIVYPSMKFIEFVGSGQNFFYGTEHYSPELPSIFDLKPTAGVRRLLIGPEAGFSPREHGLLSAAHHGQVFSLGRMTLRSETAAFLSVYNLQCTMHCAFT